VKAASILSKVWKSDFIEVKTNGSPRGGKLFYSEASEKAACLQRGTGKSALGLGLSVPLPINQLTDFICWVGRTQGIKIKCQISGQLKTCFLKKQ